MKTALSFLLIGTFVLPLVASAQVHYYGYPGTQYYTYGYPYTYSYPRPACVITATQTGGTSYGYYGYYAPTVTLSWSSANAYSASITNVGSVATQGSIRVYPTGSTSYYMTVYGPGGTNTCVTSYYQPTYQYSYPQYYHQQYNSQHMNWRQYHHK